MHMWESKHAYRKWPERVWMRTWAVIHKALSRNEVSSQLMNTEYSSYISKCKMKIRQNTLSTTVDNIKKRIQTSGPHQNPIYCSWISLINFVFWICEEFIFAYVESRRSEVCLRIEMEQKLFEWKLDSWSLFENWSVRN